MFGHKLPSSINVSNIFLLSDAGVKTTKGGHTSKMPKNMDMPGGIANRDSDSLPQEDVAQDDKGDVNDNGVTENIL